MREGVLFVIISLDTNMSGEISRVRDPFYVGAEGIPVRIRRRDWDLVEAVMKATEGIPHSAINPLSGNSVAAWEALDKVLEIWKRFYPEEAGKWWSRDAARAKLPGTGSVKDKSMRFFVSAPMGLMNVIRKVFAGQSFSGEPGKAFWYKFAERYPEMRATENV
jgi:hypothetical protein